MANLVASRLSQSTSDKAEWSSSNTGSGKATKPDDPHGIHNIEPVGVAELMEVLSPLMELEPSPTAGEVKDVVSEWLDDRWTVTDEGRSA